MINTPKAMKTYIYIMSLLFVFLMSSCQKEKINKSLSGTTWKLDKIMLNEEDVTNKIRLQKVVYTIITYGGKKDKSVSFSAPELPQVEEESGEYKIEKIVPTSGKKYYMIRNVLKYNYQRRKVFNLNEYGSELEMESDAVLVQAIGDYKVFYNKL